MKVWRLLVVGGLMVAVAACSATPARRSFKESVRDTRIKAAVRLKLTKDKDVKARSMEIDVWRGVVNLHGRALTQTERLRAEELARQVKHVVAVENQLRVVGESTAPRVAGSAPSATPVAAGPATTMPAPRPAVITAAPVGTVAAPAPVATRVPASAPKPVTATKSAPPKAAAPVTARTESSKPASASKGAEGAALSTVESVRPKSADLTKKIEMPVRKVASGKSLPWLGEIPDPEGPVLQPVREITERSKPPAVDEELAREAAEELKRLKGASAQ